MDIYEPKEDSELLKKYVSKFAIGRVLDMGTGSGIQALEAVKSKDVREVIAVDINPQAIKKLNLEVKKTLCKKIKTVKSNLFSTMEGKFNTILFNPPYLPQDKGIEDCRGRAQAETGCLGGICP